MYEPVYMSLENDSGARAAVQYMKFLLHKSHYHFHCVHNYVLQQVLRI